MSGETAVLVSVYSSNPNAVKGAIKGDIHLYRTPETSPGNFHHIICLPFIGANSYLWLYGKTSLSRMLRFILNSYGVLTGNALQNENSRGKLAISISLIITTNYVISNIFSIICYSNLLVVSKVNAGNLNLSAHRTPLSI
ncbi:hypothetical protein ES703_113259 [subsurface metagenome]